jgi:hypothetical protein
LRGVGCAWLLRTLWIEPLRTRRPLTAALDRSSSQQLIRVRSHCCCAQRRTRTSHLRSPAWASPRCAFLHASAPLVCSDQRSGSSAAAAQVSLVSLAAANVGWFHCFHRRRASASTSAPGLRPHLHRGSPTSAPVHICAGTGAHLHRDWAHRCHICTGTGRTAATSAPGLGAPLPHLHPDSGAA